MHKVAGRWSTTVGADIKKYFSTFRKKVKISLRITLMGLLSSDTGGNAFNGVCDTQRVLNELPPLCTFGCIKILKYGHCIINTFFKVFYFETKKSNSEWNGITIVSYLHVMASCNIRLKTINFSHRSCLVLLPLSSWHSGQWSPTFICRSHTPVVSGLPSSASWWLQNSIYCTSLGTPCFLPRSCLSSTSKSRGQIHSSVLSWQVQKTWLYIWNEQRWTTFPW